MPSGMNPTGARGSAALATKGSLYLLRARAARDPSARADAARLAKQAFADAFHENRLLEREHGPAMRQRVHGPNGERLRGLGLAEKPPVAEDGVRGRAERGALRCCRLQYDARQPAHDDGGRLSLTQGHQREPQWLAGARPQRPAWEGARGPLALSRGPWSARFSSTISEGGGMRRQGQTALFSPAP